MTAPCGTYAACQRHKQKNEPLDDACKAANRDYTFAFRARTTTKCAKGLGWPLRDPGRLR